MWNHAPDKLLGLLRRQLRELTVDGCGDGGSVGLNKKGSMQV